MAVRRGGRDAGRGADAGRSLRRGAPSAAVRRGAVQSSGRERARRALRRSGSTGSDSVRPTGGRGVGTSSSQDSAARARRRGTSGSFCGRSEAGGWGWELGLGRPDDGGRDDDGRVDGRTRRPRRRRPRRRRPGRRRRETTAAGTTTAGRRGAGVAARLGRRDGTIEPGADPPVGRVLGAGLPRTVAAIAATGARRRIPARLRGRLLRGCGCAARLRARLRGRLRARLRRLRRGCVASGRGCARGDARSGDTAIDLERRRITGCSPGGSGGVAGSDRGGSGWGTVDVRSDVPVSSGGCSSLSVMSLW